MMLHQCELAVVNAILTRHFVPDSPKEQYFEIDMITLSFEEEGSLFP